MVEVGEAKPALEARFVPSRKLDAVAPRQLEQHGRAHRAFEMNVELDLGAVQQEPVEAHAVLFEPALEPRRSRRRTMTGSGTRPVRLPPKAKTSLTSRLER